MKTEELTKIGITPEQAEQVLKMHKDAISGNYIPKATFDAEREKNKEMQALLDKAKSEAGDSEELRKQIDVLKAESKKLQDEYAQKETRRQHLEAVRKNLPDDVIDPDDIIARLDVDTYKYDGDTVKGLSEDIDALRKSKPHYFKSKDDSGDDKSTSFIEGIIGMQSPSESSKGGNENNDSESVQLGKQLGKLRMQSDKSSAESREAFFKN